MKETKNESSGDALVVMKPIEWLKPYDNNPRKNDEAVPAVVESIRQFGFLVPIVATEDGTILAGHTRLKASIKLGLESVPVLVAKDLDEVKAKAFRLADNKVGEIAEWDLSALNKEIEGLGDFDLTSLGFTFDEEAATKEDYYPDSKSGSLKEDFIAPPFSILDGRAGYWLERKRFWREKIKNEAQARPDAKVLDTGLKWDCAVSLFDPVLAEFIVHNFMPDAEHGTKCFDTFAGGTEFGYVSSSLGKSFKGIELRKEQADFNNEHTEGLDATYICDDGRNVKAHFEKESQDLFFSCPPYFDLEVYSDNPNDASNQASFEDFYAILDEAFTNAISCLKNDRFAVVVVGDVRNKKTGGYYDFIGRVKQTFIREGLLLYNEAILVDPCGTAPLRVRNMMRNRKLCKVHQNVLIFYKGNEKNISKYFGELKIHLEEES